MKQQPTHIATYQDHKIFSLYYRRTDNGYQPISKEEFKHAAGYLQTYFVMDDECREIERESLEECQAYIDSRYLCAGL